MQEASGLSSQAAPSKGIETLARLNCHRRLKTWISGIAMLSSALWIGMVPSSPARADQVDTVKYSQAGEWGIYADSAGGCFAIASYVRGTIVKIGFDGHDENLQPYMMVSGPRVAGAEDGAKYRARAIFDNWRPFQGVATGGRTSGGYPVVVIGLRPEFVAAFAEHNSMALEIAGEPITTLSLSGTYAALMQTIACQTAVSSYAATPSPKSKGFDTRSPAEEPRLSRF